MLPFILIALISAVITIYRKIQRHNRFERISTANNCGATHKIPLKDPILGADLLKDSYDSVKRHKYLEHAENRFFEIGTTFESNMMGAMVINTIEPENIKTILSTKFEDYELGSRRKNAFVPLIGHGIFTSDGPQWKHSRHLLRPNFTREQVGDINVLGRHAKHLIDVIPRDGSVVDLQDLFFRYTMDTGTELLFGKSTLSLLSTGGDDTTGSRFGDAFSRSQETMSQNYCLGKLAYLRPNKQFKEDSKYIHGWVDRLVRKALDSYHEGSKARSAASSRASSRRNSFVSECSSVPEERYVFLHELAKQTDDPLQLRSELLNLLIAGRDSTASLLSNLWFEMARRPDVWAKLREEVDTLGGSDFSVAQLKDMTYLHNCLNECTSPYLPPSPPLFHSPKTTMPSPTLPSPPHPSPQQTMQRNQPTQTQPSASTPLSQ